MPKSSVIISYHHTVKALLISKLMWAHTLSRSWGKTACHPNIQPYSMGFCGTWLCFFFKTSYLLLINWGIYRWSITTVDIRPLTWLLLWKPWALLPLTRREWAKYWRKVRGKSRQSACSAGRFLYNGEFDNTQFKSRASATGPKEAVREQAEQDQHTPKLMSHWYPCRNDCPHSSLKLNPPIQFHQELCCFWFFLLGHWR